MDCSVDGCVLPGHAKGLCKKHWHYARMRGTPTDQREFVCAVCGRTVTYEAKIGRPPSVCSDACFAERARQKARAWVRDNPERRADYRECNRERLDRAYREYYLRNKDRERERALSYKRAHPERSSAADARRYALKKGSYLAETFSLDEIYERDNRTCYLCGAGVDRREATIDHVIPVTRGGWHVRANVRLAHRGCNTRKSNHFG